MIASRINSGPIEAVASQFRMSPAQVLHLARLWAARKDTLDIANDTGLKESQVTRVLSALRERRRG